MLRRQRANNHNKMVAYRAALIAATVFAAGGASAQPLVASYSTFIGSASAPDETVNAVAADDAGNVYVGGLTRFDTVDVDFPTTPSSLRLPNSDSPDTPCRHGCGFVLKLDRNHNLVYGALLPYMEVQALAVDDDGAVHATGEFIGGFTEPHVTPGVFSTEGSLFVLKVRPDGAALEHSAVFPGNEARAIAVDASGNAYIVGEIAGDTFPTTPNAVKASKDTFSFDAFLLKINPTATAVLAGTYLGGSEYDGAYGVALDGTGGAYVAGRTVSSDFVGFAQANAGAGDAFILHVSADASQIVAGRAFAGSGDEVANALSSDGLGGLLVAGATTSANLPVTTGVLQGYLLGERNGWLARLDADLTSRYVTYFGGSFVDGILAVTAADDGAAFVVGTTFSADLLTTPDGFQDASSAYSIAMLGSLGKRYYPLSDAVREAFVASISGDGTEVLYGSYLGGVYAIPRHNAALTFGAAVARGGDGVVSIGGTTAIESFPVIAGGLRDEMGGRIDGFLVRLEPQQLAISTPTLLAWAREGRTYQYQLEASGVAPYAWELAGFKLPDGLSLDDGGRITGTPTTQSEYNGYQFTARATDASGRTAHKSFILNMEYGGQAVCVPDSCEGSFSVGQPAGYDLPYLARGLPPITLSTSGTLPPGVTVDLSNGNFGGMPTTAGVYDFAFTVRDALNQMATVSWRITVHGQSLTPPNPTPPPTPPAPQPTPSGGGGGGALREMELACLILMALVVVHRRTRSRR